MSEKLSDQCMMELMTSAKNETCNISEECIKMMTMRGLTGYSITHQLLWSVLSERFVSFIKLLQTCHLLCLPIVIMFFVCFGKLPFLLILETLFFYPPKTQFLPRIVSLV